MISFEDCVALCGLTKAEIAAIAEHEHIPDIAAAMLGQYLVQQHKPDQICRMISDDVRAATAARDWKHVRQLVAALQHFLASYPGCREALPPTRI
jgi:hypothetical protein